MDRSAYQEAIKKFIYVDGDKAQDYISLQLVSEVGELLGGYAKRLVGRDISDEYLELEAGDICFFLAWLCNIRETDFSTIVPSPIDFESWVDTADTLAAETSALVYFSKAENLLFDFRFAVATLLGWVLLLIPPGKSLEAILQMNIDKLEVRHGTPA